VQVYRGRLRANNAEVAVKVQRPGIRGELSLDVLVLRTLAKVLSATRPSDPTNYVQLVDEWAVTLYKVMRSCRAGRCRRLPTQNGGDGLQSKATHPSQSSGRPAAAPWCHSTPLGSTCHLSCAQEGHIGSCPKAPRCAK